MANGRRQDPIVSKETLRREVESFKTIACGAAPSQLTDALTALVVVWVACEMALSERQAVAVIHFFGERSPESIPAIKRAFFGWMEQLGR